MLVLDVALLVLLGVALVFSIIELGLSADEVSLDSHHYYTYYNNGYGYGYGVQTGSPPGEISFLLFCSLWTMLVTVFLIGFGFFMRRRNNALASNNTNKWLTPLTLALTAVTMIFWLAGFAALAHLYNGADVTGIAAALLAFAVLLW